MPAPAATSTCPTSEEAGQEGLWISSAPSFGWLLACAWAICASEHIPTPASFPVRPGGRVVSIPASGCVASSLATFKTKGEKAPAWGAIVPAEKEGEFEASLALLGHLPPPGATWIAKESDGCALAVSGALHGSMLVVVE